MIKSFILSTLFALHGNPEFPATGPHAVKPDTLKPTPVSTSIEVANKPSLLSRFQLVVNGLSWHIGDRGFDTPDTKDIPYNEVNPGLAVEYSVNDHFHLTTGFYKNSFYEQAYYIGGGYETKRERPIGFGIEAALITGYEDYVSVPFIGLPYVRFGGENLPINIKMGVIPADPVGLTLQARLNL